MKYLVILGDGMADHKLEELENKTPLEFANKPNIDMLAGMGEVGLIKTVPDGMKPGSDIANLAIMGYNPQQYYSGRSPLEAVSIGINLKETDIAVRCNLVTLSKDEPYENKIMIDYSAGEISTEEATELINYLERELGSSAMKFYAGVSYRHCLVWDMGKMELGCTPPHDILDCKITNYLPSGNNSEILIELHKKSYELLSNHPINIEREKKGLNPANSIWLWGEGKKPALKNFKQVYGLRPSVISAVDLIKGIGICAGFSSIDVEGATGTVHTNFDGKTQAVIDEFERGQEFVYAHFEAPDECGHQNDLENKIKSIEIIDQKVVGPLYNYLKRTGDSFAILILPDHPTPVKFRTHTSDPVPYIIYRHNELSKTDKATVVNPNNESTLTTYKVTNYNEETASKTGIFISDGYKIIERLIEK